MCSHGRDRKASRQTDEEENEMTRSNGKCFIKYHRGRNLLFLILHPRWIIVEHWFSLEASLVADDSLMPSALTMYDRIALHEPICDSFTRTEDDVQRRLNNFPLRAQSKRLEITHTIGGRSKN